MTKSAMEREAEMIHFSLYHEPLMNYEETIIFLLSRLRAVHNAAIEKAAATAANQIRALKIGENNCDAYKTSIYT